MRVGNGCACACLGSLAARLRPPFVPSVLERLHTHARFPDHGQFHLSSLSIVRTLRQVMSSNGEAIDRGGMGSAASGVPQTVPRLVLGVGAYGAWRPVMENTLLRAGVTTRDYREENPDWAALAAAVDQWARAEEEASIAYALGRVAAVSSSSTSSAGTGPSAAEKEARRGAIEAVARTRRAYTLLYQALSDELRRLSASVPQGDAYGLWSWLEKRFQSTEQDSIGDLWDEFTQMSQGDDESFDAYKARVDRVYGLLTHAKDKPSPGLYAHRLLWKLSPRYNAAVLALKASGKLKVAAAIDWEEIVAFVNNHERSEQRLAGEHTGADGGAMIAAAMRSSRGGDGTLASVICYNCGGKGHIARHCKKPRRRTPAQRRDDAGAHEEDDSHHSGNDDPGNKPVGKKDNSESAMSRGRAAGRSTGGHSQHGPGGRAAGHGHTESQYVSAVRTFEALTSDEDCLDGNSARIY